MLSRLDGATRVSVIIGTPIEQVRSPDGITREMQARGVNALLIPFEVAPGDVARVAAALGCIRNLDGITVTVPHKQAAFGFCRVTTERARFLGAVNVMRRLDGGSFSGDHVDGESLVGAIRRAGGNIAGKRVLVIGAGGAGSAIALSLMEAGAQSMVVADLDEARRDDLAARLESRFAGRVRAGGADPRSFDLIVNATPIGMRPGDPAPFDLTHIEARMMIADVVTPPSQSALMAAARAKGCVTVDGREMFDAGVGLITDFMLGTGVVRD